jgi:phosphate:Na+ symporter
LDITTTTAALLSGLGLFFIGVRSLSANLVPLAGRRTRAAFARALRGPASSAASGTLAGLMTQSSSAVSWIIVGFVRAGVLTVGPALTAPMWSNVGTALLPLLVAIDTLTAASMVIGFVGFAIYFKLARTDRLRNMLEAALGAALVLFGMHIVSSVVGPVREAMMSSNVLATATHSPWLLAAIGAGFSFAAQSSSVAAAIAVAGVGAHLFDFNSALPLIAGANAAAICNNAMMMLGETLPGRCVFGLQALQKATGSLLLVAFAVAAAWWPAEAASIMSQAASGAGGQIAVVFAVAQLGGALVTSVLARRVEMLLRRWAPVNPADALAQPAFLLREALTDPPVALDLTVREVARLSARLPLLLDRVRAEADPATPAATVLLTAGATLADAIRGYLASLLDNQPNRNEVASALQLKEAADNAGDLHEAVAELVAAVPVITSLPITANLVEALHVLLAVVADHAESLGADDPDFVLGLFGDRDELMEELRQRFASGAGVGVEIQDALFRVTVLFERIIWLARRLVVNLSRAHRTMSAD